MKVLCFGIAKDIVGESFLELEDDKVKSVADLKTYLIDNFPAFKDYASFMVAVNQSYAKGEQCIGEHDEIAIIPPVSGG